MFRIITQGSCINRYYPIDKIALKNVNVVLLYGAQAVIYLSFMEKGYLLIVFITHLAGWVINYN